MEAAVEACPHCRSEISREIGSPAICPECGKSLVLHPEEGDATPLPSALYPELVGGRYHLVSRLGKGGAGTVYRAWDTKLEEETAIKILQAGSSDATELARFKREITTARKISHPNVIRIHDFGESGNDVFISMELLVGGTLSRRIEQGLTLLEGLTIAVGICEGVQAAHALGIIHRDLKPENILFDAFDRPRVADFGLARLQTVGSNTLGFSGTPYYMSPEHANGQDITTRSDVYSLGVVLFLMFTRRLPFKADNFVRLVNLHCHELPPRPSTITSMPAELERIILRALEKDPRARHANAGDLAADLANVLRLDAGVVRALESLSVEELEGIVALPTTTRAQACAALDQLSKRHGASGNVIDQASVLERLAARLPAGGAEKLTVAGELLSAIDRDRAIRCWERAVAEDPGSIRALEHLVSAHEERNEWHALLAGLNALIAAYKERNPKAAAEAFCRKGSVLLHHVGLPEKAKQHFRLALDVDPKYLPALQALAALAEEEGDLELARTSLESLFALGAPDAAARLEKLPSKGATAQKQPAPAQKKPVPPAPRTTALVVREKTPVPPPAPREVEERRRRVGAAVWGPIAGAAVLAVVALFAIVGPSRTAEVLPTPTPLAQVSPVTTAEELPPTPAPTPELTPAATPEATPVKTAHAVRPTATPKPSATKVIAATPAPTPTRLAVIATPKPATPTPVPTAAPVMDPALAAFDSGNVLLKQGKVAEAVRELKKAVKANPGYADGHFFLAAAYAAASEDAYACSELERYVALAPGGRYAAQAKANLANCR